MPNYQLTKKAQLELEGIYEYSILNFGLDKARIYIQGLHTSFATLADNPKMGRDYYHLKEDYRRYEYERHSVYYKITKTGVLISRILGPGQDPIKNIM
ncbi:MAG: type II toxin-antitoxin system RelE/ParE family toxin [Nitrospirae bacterium]|nr:type II toxin-antitoxin system RelE/ParE family toxin [Nitrospirota bacterium]MDA1304435.1 type II toxin-antitoxin system RelE/ParE family toxin [Nitrospirota bacterium]